MRPKTKERAAIDLPKILIPLRDVALDGQLGGINGRQWQRVGIERPSKVRDLAVIEAHKGRGDYVDSDEIDAGKDDVCPGRIRGLRTVSLAGDDPVNQRQRSSLGSTRNRPIGAC